MKLYHGTTAAALTSILTNGIQPRTDAGNWTRCPSKSGYVYLTQPYPLYFANSAVATVAPADPEQREAFFQANPLLVVEVETDRLDADDFAPDEDFVAQAILMNRRGGMKTGNDDLDAAPDLITLTNLIEPCLFAENWQLSVETMGQCCHLGPIPLHAITRYAVLDYDKAFPIIGEALEPTITIANYQICGTYYNALTAFFMGDREQPPQNRAVFMFSDTDPADLEEQIYGKLSMAQRDHWKRQEAGKIEGLLTARRDGIQVVAVNP